MAGKKKGKAPKKTKEQLDEERRIQEEEEANRRAEEEKRIEEERKRREVEEAKRQEEAAKNRAAELERLIQEHETTKLDVEGKEQRLQDIRRVQKEARDWEKYLACESRPDARVEGDVNSFINSWQMDEGVNFKTIASSCENAHAVMDELLFVGAHARAVNDNQLHAQCQSFLSQIQTLEVERVEDMTADVLQYADEYADSSNRSEIKLESCGSTRGLQVGIWINLIAKGSRNKRIEFSNIRVSVDLPKAVILQPLALRAIHVPFHTVQDVISLDEPIGGVFTIDLLDVPPPPKRARGWVMRDLTPLSLSGEKVKKLQYPLEGMVMSAASPIKVSVVLPEYALYPEQPRVAWWDGHQWQEEGITDVTFQTETNLLTMSTMKLTQLAVVQRRDRNFHKQHWSLTAKGDSNHMEESPYAVLKLQTLHLELVVFKISDKGCRLVEPMLPPLVPLQNTWMSPGELLMRLEAAGICLCPTLADDACFGVSGKLKALEDRVIDEIVSIASAFEVNIGDPSIDTTPEEDAARTMKWKSLASDSSKIVFSVQEIRWPFIDDDENNDKESDIVSTAKYNVIAQVDDEVAGGGVKFRLDPNNEYDTHVHLKMALEDTSSPDARDRIKHSNILFEFMLKKLLRLLRLFSYSSPITGTIHAPVVTPMQVDEHAVTTEAAAAEPASESQEVNDATNIEQEEGSGKEVKEPAEQIETMPTEMTFN